MAKLHFFHGTMGSSKSLDLIRANYNYREKGLNTLVFKPAIDTREGTTKCIIKTRAGDLSVEGDFIPSDKKSYQLFKQKLFAKLSVNNPANPQVSSANKPSAFTKISAIFIDEAQFLTAKQVEDFQHIVYKFDIPVLCYGLKNNFKSKLFAGSKRLIELADDIQEIRSICHCGHRTRQNGRVVNGKLTRTGAEIIIGDNLSSADIYYTPLCNECYLKGRIKSS